MAKLKSLLNGSLDNELWEQDLGPKRGLELFITDEVEGQWQRGE